MLRPIQRTIQPIHHPRDHRHRPKKFNSVFELLHRHFRRKPSETRRRPSVELPTGLPENQNGPTQRGHDNETSVAPGATMGTNVRKIIATKFKTYLLQRITRNPSSTRNEVMATYERFDLLDIRNCSHRNGQALPKNSKLLESFYCPKKTPDILQESIARLINTFASMKLGRDYLTRQSILMNFLLSILLGTHSLKPKLDSKTRDMTIATMQKMSLRYWQRVTMINAGEYGNS